MKKLALFSTLAFAVVLLSGCMDKPETNPADMDDTVNGEEIISTGTTTTVETTDTADTTTTGTETTTTTVTTKIINISDVALHKTPEDCQTAINGTVYDVTAFFGKHPGGDKNLFRVCGIDATQVFNRQHGNDPKANNVLAGFEIGTLAK
jgi:cytochrome b involved in lipid metabolism